MQSKDVLLQGSFSTESRGEDSESGMPAVKWVGKAELESEGLSSGVQKALKMVLASAKDEAAKAGGISKFFKAVPKSAKAGK